MSGGEREAGREIGIKEKGAKCAGQFFFSQEETRQNKLKESGEWRRGVKRKVKEEEEREREIERKEERL